MGHCLNADRKDSRLGASSKSSDWKAPRRAVPYEVGLSRERVLRHLEPEHLISPMRGTFRSRRRNGRHAPAPLEYSRLRGVAIELAAGIDRAGAERRVYGGRTRLRSLGSAALVRCLALFLDDQETLGRDAGQRPTSALGVSITYRPVRFGFAGFPWIKGAQGRTDRGEGATLARVDETPRTFGVSPPVLGASYQQTLPFVVPCAAPRAETAHQQTQGGAGT